MSRMIIHCRSEDGKYLTESILCGPYSFCYEVKALALLTHQLSKLLRRAYGTMTFIAESGKHAFKFLDR